MTGAATRNRRRTTTVSEVVNFGTAKVAGSIWQHKVGQLLPAFKFNPFTPRRPARLLPARFGPPARRRREIRAGAPGALTGIKLKGRR
ncbi:hypothetical protein RRG08_022828 [Elysia crispata]|uniref:Uncharacterized protein n=1 Tax=Elysia crispata TaxID=231223 RepID=A0AAE1D7P9_9GAST|nr:hypothetical protein RRG08_022828 [Elysia crispata]